MRLLLLAALCCCASLLRAQTVYVNGGNPTPGDGTSWATAYTDLNEALLGAPAGAEVWIAAGTYVTPDTASFFIDKELTVLGGFAGTETSADAADPVANETILSGDVLGNDPEMTYDSTLFDDNNRVLFITDTSETSAYVVRLDGLTVTHGAIARAQGEDDSFNDFGGGGLRSYARLNATRLKFTNNYAAAGSAVFVRFASSNGTLLDGIELDNNFTAAFRAVYVANNDGMTITNSVFRGNGEDVLATSGMLRINSLRNFTLSNSTFSEIYTDAAGGIGLFTDTEDTRVINCTATDLRAAGSNAGLLANTRDGYDPGTERDADDFIVDGCTFDGMTAVGWGASVYGDNVNMTVRNCTIVNALTGRNGAAIYWQADSGNPADEYEIVVENTLIEDNEGGAFGGATSFLFFDTATLDLTLDNVQIIDNIANDGRGGALYYQGESGNISISNSDVLENFGESGAFVVNANAGFTARNVRFNDNGDANLARRGGAVTCFIEDGPGIVIDSCEFINNRVTQLTGLFSAGGGFYLFAGDRKALPLTVTNTEFRSNTTTGGAAGGAMYVSRAVDGRIENCDFITNTCGDIGGAFHGRTFESVDSRDTLADGSVSVIIQPHDIGFKNCRFITNTSQTQGGAIGTFRTAYDIENSLFYDNRVGTDGASGGAIIYNGLSTGITQGGDVLLTGDLELEATLVHNTFVDNVQGGADGAVGSAIALFQNGPGTANGDTTSLTLRLLNNAFLSSFQDPAIELEPDFNADGTAVLAFGDVEVISLGGNFYNAENGPDVSVGAQDVLDVSVEDDDAIRELFVDIFDDVLEEGVNADLNISDFPNNPLVNNGVVDPLVPAEDIRGNPRGDRPDIGAYEADQEAVSVAEPIENSGLNVRFFPNPTANFLTIRNEEATVTGFEVQVTDVSGRVITNKSFNGTDSVLDLTDLAPGVYNLQLRVNGSVYSKQVIKQ